MNVLLVWTSPDQTNYFRISNPDEDTLKTLKEAHRTFLGTDCECDATRKLDAAIIEPDSIADEAIEEPYRAWIGKFADDEIDSSKPIEGPFDLIIESGWV